MRILYRRSRATVKQIRAELPGSPSPSTVRKLLEILGTKGEVDREYEGPRHVYFPATPAAEAGASLLREAVRTFFGGSKSRAVAALLGRDGEALSDDEYERIRELLDEGREER